MVYSPPKRGDEGVISIDKILTNVSKRLNDVDIHSEYDYDKQELYVPLGPFPINGGYAEFIQVTPMAMRNSKKEIFFGIAHGFVINKYIHIEPPMKTSSAWEYDLPTSSSKGVNIIDKLSDYIMRFYHERTELMQRKNFTPKSVPESYNYKPSEMYPYPKIKPKPPEGTPPDIINPVDINGLEWLFPDTYTR